MKKFSAVFLAIALCASLCACNTTPKQLPAPQNLHTESKVLVWDKVEHATGYVVYFDEVEHETTFRHYDLSALTVPGTYEIEVMALGDGDYISSAWTNFSYTVAGSDEEDAPPSPSAPAQYDEAGFEYRLLPDGSGYEISRGNADGGEILELPDTFNALPVKRIADSAFAPPAWNLSDILTESIRFPAYLESIGRSAFYKMFKLEEIVIPDTVKEIGVGAFTWCPRLKHVTLPKNLKVLGRGCFEYCALEEIVLPDGLEEIGEHAFASDDSGILSAPQTYTSIVIPDSVKRIERGAFSCKALREVTLPGNLEWISARAFAFSAWDEALPEGPVIIGDLFYKFNSNEHVESYTVPAGVKKIAGGAFEEVLTLKDDLYTFLPDIAEIVIPDGVKLIGDFILSNRNLKKVRLPADLTEIPEQTFNSCKLLTDVSCKLLTDVEIPQSVVSIETHAFSYCENIASVSLPAGLLTLGDSAFEYCTMLKEIVIPASLENLGSNVFGECDALEKVFYEGTKRKMEALKAQNNVEHFSDGSIYENPVFTDATVYYYSETKPLADGYWRYVDGIPTLW